MHAFGICDKIIAEPEGGAAKNIGLTASNIAAWLRDALSRLEREDYDSLPEKRYAKFRAIGVFSET